jgi:hypothetical protein
MQPSFSIPFRYVSMCLLFSTASSTTAILTFAIRTVWTFSRLCAYIAYPIGVVAIAGVTAPVSVAMLAAPATGIVAHIVFVRVAA